MAKRRESFGVTVSQYNQQSNWRQEETKPVYKKSAGNKQEAIDNRKKQNAVGSNDTRRYFPDGCPGILSIEAAIEITIKSHGSAARKNHAQDNQRELEKKYPIQAMRMTIGKPYLKFIVSFRQIP